MKRIISDKLPRILKNKKRLEKKLDVKISNRGKELSVEGNSLNEYTANMVIEALTYGFPYSATMRIKEEGAIFEVLNIKDYTKSNNLERVRGRIIGKDGATLKTLQQLTKCDFEIKGNQVAIIGDPEYIENAQNAVISIIKGSKQSNVYAFLEKHQIKPVIDLGLKE